MSRSVLGREASEASRSLRRSWVVVALVFFALLMSAPSGFSAAPILEHFHPPGLAAGSTNSVRVIGKFDPWPPQVWVDAPGITFLAQTNKGEFVVTVDPDAAVGARLVRLFNGEGASEPGILVIGGAGESMEIEPNDHFSKAQPITTLPQTSNGRLDKAGDVDSYRVTLKAGEELVAHIDSIVLMSRLDAVLRLVDTNGLQLAWNHDFATLDPRITWRAPIDQTVVVQVFGFAYPATADVRLTGGDGAVYRLRCELAGQPAGATNHLELSATPAPLVELPVVIREAIRKPGEIDRVRLRLKKDEWIAAAVDAESIGSLLDAWLRLDDREGKQIVRNDDANESRDPALEWRAPADDEYAIALGSLTRQAGEEYFYALSIAEVQPDFKASAAVSSLAIKPGSTNDLKVTVTRLRGFTNGLELAVKELPAGLRCDPVPVPEKGGEVKLALITPADAPAHQRGISLRVRDLVTQRDRAVPFMLTGSSSNNGVPGGYRALLVDRTEVLWLTVLPVEKPVSPPATAAGK